MTGRLKMVEKQIVARGVKNHAVLEAMRHVPRHEFVPEEYQSRAYEDYPLPISHNQTISQPYVVAFMTELLRVKPGDRVLEIGTGCGYQAAILWQLTTNVFTIEIVPPLHERAKVKLVAQGFPAANIRLGDGHQGWPEQAPFDAIIVTAAPEEIPPALVGQLKPGGLMVIPVGHANATQELQAVEKQADGTIAIRDILPVRFVPLTR